MSATHAVDYLNAISRSDSAEYICGVIGAMVKAKEPILAEIAGLEACANAWKAKRLSDHELVHMSCALVQKATDRAVSESAAALLDAAMLKLRALDRAAAR